MSYSKCLYNHNFFYNQFQLNLFKFKIRCFISTIPGFSRYCHVLKLLSILGRFTDGLKLQMINFDFLFHLNEIMLIVLKIKNFIF